MHFFPSALIKIHFSWTRLTSLYWLIPHHFPISFGNSSCDLYIHLKKTNKQRKKNNTKTKPNQTRTTTKPQKTYHTVREELNYQRSLDQLPFTTEKYSDILMKKCYLINLLLMGSEFSIRCTLYSQCYSRHQLISGFWIY